MSYDKNVYIYLYYNQNPNLQGPGSSENQCWREEVPQVNFLYFSSRVGENTIDIFPYSHLGPFIVMAMYFLSQVNGVFMRRTKKSKDCQHLDFKK